MTPYELASSPVHLGDLSVLFLSAGGGNPDILGCFDAVAQARLVAFAFFAPRTRTPLAARAAAVSAVPSRIRPADDQGRVSGNQFSSCDLRPARASVPVRPPRARPLLPHHLEDLDSPGSRLARSSKADLPGLAASSGTGRQSCFSMAMSHRLRRSTWSLNSPRRRLAKSSWRITGTSRMGGITGLPNTERAAPLFLLASQEDLP